NMEYVYFLAPNTEAQKLVSEEFREDPAVMLPPELIARSEVIRDLGDDNVKYNRIWDEIKAAE
ncbi:MAG: spermidine/putrescine ABC transporter substrate-binding protein, partial [Kiritimatiellae bacterium]|nr:spermidine/putrescine ABC transporter substrate-binding protein [Kiritimatiellia bacterium]